MARRYTTDQGYSPGTLLQYGRDHLACAKILFEKSFECHDSAGHLSHLGIELILKGVLLNACGSFPNQHDLVKLFTEIRQHDVSFDLDRKQRKVLAAINCFAGIRYPNPEEPITIGDTDWQRTLSLYKALLQAMPQSLREEMARRDPTRKGGRVLMRRPKTEWEKRATTAKAGRCAVSSREGQ
jgi:HEPN domain-containing protein